jgi:hypothetical protein
MALWGNNDNIGIASINALANQGSGAGIITVTSAGAVTGAVGVCTFTGLALGDVITVGQGQTGGFGTILEIASDTSMTISTSAVDKRSWEANNDYETRYMIFSQQPISADVDPIFAPSSADYQRDYDAKVFGINKDNLGTADPTDRDALLNAVTHAGWVGVQTYLDYEGNLRIKAETLVAGGADYNGVGGISTGNRAYPPA